MKLSKIFLTIVAVCAMMSCAEYSYDKVSGDSTKTRIYTLDNGLKVYMSVNREAPRIQTIISVRVGSKNDPKETTGLAHYFEHLMFKGTERFGTQDYAAEKPLLDEIERLFEVYRQTECEKERKRIYAQIDSVSQEASKYAIPNEYDKLMQAIGASGTNAWTSYDETSYIDEIPSNQLENWAKIASDRFENAVIRGFHTELETVYEEYNMGLTRDMNKLINKLFQHMAPNHPYGHHSPIGLQEHLKNPSITNIKNYYKTYYVPNNMAICLSGDFDPDVAIRLIDQYFGAMKPNENLPSVEEYKVEKRDAICRDEVYGLQNECVVVGWPTSGADSEDALMSDIVSSILYNGKCGLVDTDLIQRQRVLATSVSAESLSDMGVVLAYGVPKQGQTLEEVEALFMEEVAKLRRGEFDEELLESIIANLRVKYMGTIEENMGRAVLMSSSFVNNIDWEDVIDYDKRASKVTKQQIVDWANNRLAESSAIVVYKRQGKDESERKIEKPQITPIATNRDVQSQFLTDIQSSEVSPIEPVFVDYERDMSLTKMNGNVDVLYKRNETNELFSLIYLYNRGTNTDPAMSIAVDYMNMLGTDRKSLAELQSELYSIACSLNVVSTATQTYVVMSGLSDNMDKAIALAEDYLANVKGDDAVLAEIKSDIFKQRENNKSDQQANYRALYHYVNYGADAIRRTVLSNDAIQALTSDELLGRIRSLANYEHQILYYGPMKCGALVKMLNASHKVGDKLLPTEFVPLRQQRVDKPTVTFAQYDAKQIYYLQYSCNDERYNQEKDAVTELYNTYFSGSMNAIVFQEMREARGLAYTAWAHYATPSIKSHPYSFSAFIATQNDKMRQAVEAFDEIIEDMPRSEAAFELAKQGLLSNYATQRTVRINVLWSYVSDKLFGMENNDKLVYEGVKSLTLDDVVDFQQKSIKGRKYNYGILGDRRDVDMRYLRKLGDVKFVSQEEIFGY
ncbi:MAG: insulinase family protein [Alistipes sp.]|nr:insulinase family protein [Alistipes sp.]